MATLQDRVESGRLGGKPGPRSIEGKEISRRNSARHFLSGSGAVIPDEDLAEVDRRATAYLRDLDIRTDVGRDLARQMAIVSVRIDRCARHEASAIAHARRHAVDRHDDARQDEADRLFAALGEDPRGCLRRLRRMPEGIERLVQAWRGLRDELTRKPQPRWTAWHRERAEHLTGNRLEDCPYTEIGDLSEQITGAADEATKAEARARMIGRIDAEVAALEAHDRTLDHELLELDRREAPARSSFDDSKAATLARRYEAEASRRFFKLMNQLKAIEAEAADRPASPATPTPLPTSAPTSSFREMPRQEPYAPLGGFGAEGLIELLARIERIGDADGHDQLASGAPSSRH